MITAIPYIAVFLGGVVVGVGGFVLLIRYVR